jgi:hypothetical protein
MPTTQPRAQTLRRGFLIRNLPVGVVIFVVALIAGAELWIAAMLGFFLGLFVGGGLGPLVSGRISAEPG